ncbi:MAG: histidine utilization repressor [Proteobacteria bacterium]|nr:histidine utilization repressor [Pseudomonadota bacterium]
MPVQPPAPSRAESPLYQVVKDHVLAGILDGTWAPGARVPSEQELVAALGVARMTANRALRELAVEGYLTRRQGLGSFVAEPKPQSELLELRNIADEIAARGHVHSCDVLVHERCRADQRIAGQLGLPPGTPVFHSLCVHRENGLPVQLEDRHVNPAAAPGYLKADLRTVTATQYLIASVPADAIEHTVEAVLPDPRTRCLLELKRSEPCLSVQRRTWSGGAVVTAALLTYPGSRYRLGGRLGQR